MKYNELRPLLKTGDLVFFSGKSISSRLIRLASRSRWSHVGMLVRCPATDAVMLLESTKREGGGIIQGALQGVHLMLMSEKLREYHGEVWVRQIRRAIPTGRLNGIHNEDMGKPYERSLLQLVATVLPFRVPERPRSIFCSELVARALHKAGWPMRLPVNEYTPGDLATEWRRRFGAWVQVVA